MTTAVPVQQSSDADEDDRDRDDLGGRDAEERPVVGAQRLQDEPRRPVPDEEHQQQVGGPESGAEPEPEPDKERRTEDARDRLIQEQRVEPRGQLGQRRTWVDIEPMGAFDRDPHGNVVGGPYSSWLK